MKNFLKYRFTLVVVVVVILILVGLGLFYLGDQYALNKMNVLAATPTQMAEAMKNDLFYSKYRENTLVFSGQVLSISKDGLSSIANIKTSSSYGLFCKVGLNQVKVGSSYRFIAEAYQAKRQTSALMFDQCFVL